MTNISKIIAFLDQIIEKQGVDHLTAVEANKVLAHKKLLNDSKARPGLPLRKLLRAQKIPHAYQLGGKNSKWYIPHSSIENPTRHHTGITDKPVKKRSSYKKLTAIEEKKLLNQISKARHEYQPPIIKCLLIAEAPPDSIERFFYYTHVKTADYLFLGISGVLYPEKKKKYIDWGRPWSIKKEILSQFQLDGFYLIDLLDIPLKLFKGNLSEKVEPKIQEIQGLISLDIPIIITKSNVYDIIHNPLVSSGFTNVSNIRIPFPGQGWQIEFSNKFRKALSLERNKSISRIPERSL